jgi:uncharacterized protein (DUF58 family)
VSSTATSRSTAARPPRFSRDWWSGHTPVPTGRLVVAVAVLAAVALVVPLGVVVLGAVLLLGLVVFDHVSAPAPWRVEVARELPPLLTLDGRGEVLWRVVNPTGRRLTVALADELAPSLGASTRAVQVTLPAAGRSTARAGLAPTRRGTFRPGGLSLRVVGRLGLVTRQARRELPGRVEVHPSFRSREAAELRIRRARILEEGQRSVRQRGGGTEFESLREYVQGDEFRHIDWAATARAGEPIVRTYRTERNQTVLVLLDTGRTVAGLVEGVPRLDHGMDATLALATVATHLGDRLGLLAFGAGVRTLVPPRRDRGQLRRLSGAMHALEPELAESGYRDAFHRTLAQFRRRAFVVIVTELATEAAQETLLPSLPVLAREHAVVVASVRDPALDALRQRRPEHVEDAYAAAAASAVATDRERVAARLRGMGVRVVDAPPDQLAARLVDTYLDVKTGVGW